MKILVIEDNDRVAQFIRKGLVEEGHTVDHADNGRDGLFLAATGRLAQWISLAHLAVRTR